MGDKFITGHNRRLEAEAQGPWSARTVIVGGRK